MSTIYYPLVTRHSLSTQSPLISLVVQRLFEAAVRLPIHVG